MIQIRRDQLQTFQSTSLSLIQFQKFWRKSRKVSGAATNNGTIRQVRQINRQLRVLKLSFAWVRQSRRPDFGRSSAWFRACCADLANFLLSLRIYVSEGVWHELVTHELQLNFLRWNSPWKPKPFWLFLTENASNNRNGNLCSHKRRSPAKNFSFPTVNQRAKMIPAIELCLAFSLKVRRLVRVCSRFECHCQSLMIRLMVEVAATENSARFLGHDTESAKLESREEKQR